MRQLPLALVLCLAAAACGPTKVDVGGDSPDLNRVPVRISPTGGAYGFRPMVTLVKDTTERETGTLEVQLPEMERFTEVWHLFGAPAGGCTPPDLEKPAAERRRYACVRMTQSGELYYRLSPGYNFGQRAGRARSEHYEIALETFTLAASSEGALPLLGDSFQLSERETRCYVRDDGNGGTRLQLRMTTENPAALTDWPTTTIDLDLEAPVAGGSYTIDAAAGPGRNTVSIEAQAAVAGTRGPSHATEALQGAESTGSCVVTVESIALNGVTRGTLQCDALPRQSGNTDAAPFGDTLSVSGAWSCDEYD